LFSLFFLLILSLWLPAQVSLEYYLPDGTSYDPAIPTPEEVLGYQVGEWHVSHDKLVQYMTTLAAFSDRMSIDTIGFTYERRPLLHLTVSSPANHQRMEEIRTQHLQLTDPENSEELNINEMPVVVWLGYNIHGNEASASNSALLVAYHLAAYQGEEMEEMLDNMVVILDPCFNPDGLQRFATWVNSHRGIKVLNADPNSREHNEAWPRGRTNHYWFDLNRDWLPVQHLESQARIARFHHWKPNYLTDHHEMGTNSTYFFQPGIPSRNNPLTPQNTFTLTYKMAEYYAAALDEIGSLYYTEESFDDFYYGKGSTYPDVNGAVGILFEQASSRGHVQESDNGLLDFPFTIRNQLATSLATLQGTFDLRTDLLEHQRNFYQTAIESAQKDPNQAYMFAAAKDEQRTHQFIQMLLRHQVEVYGLNQTLTVNGRSFGAGEAFVVPFEQPQYRLVEAMFGKVTTFQDSLFYDVSAWTLPLAFDLPYEAVGAKAFSSKLLGDRLTVAPTFTSKEVDATYALAFEWYHYSAPALLNQIVSNGIRAKVATQSFTHQDGRAFEPGTVVVPLENQHLSAEDLRTKIQAWANQFEVPLFGFPSGNTAGTRLGSGSFRSLKDPKVVILADGDISSYEVGEVWHLLDYRMEMDVTILPVDRVGRMDLSRYGTIVMVGGGYRSLDGNVANKISEWTSGGGTLIAYKSAINWLKKHSLSNISFKSAEKSPALADMAYADRSKVRGAQVTGGAIFQAELDRTHPLGYGYEQDQIAVFRNSNLFLSPIENTLQQPLRYTEEPLLSGYVSEENLEALKGSAVIQVERRGRGHVIAMTDNPNFRAFWYGTNKLFLNAVFFGPVIQ
ncbi:MAG: M14 metallopeptidase family protein, partial [Bacteroidota bacterium]